MCRNLHHWRRSKGELLDRVLDKLPTAELEHSLTSFLAPLLDRLPGRRLRRVVPLAVQGILASETPVVTAMAQSVARTDARPWAAAKRIYRLLANPRVPPHRLTKGLYHLTRASHLAGGLHPCRHHAGGNGQGRLAAAPPAGHAATPVGG